MRAHDKLVRRACAWLEKRANCSIVLAEPSGAASIPDAIGYKTCETWVAECKTSRSDFRADVKKDHRNEDGTTLGTHRVYFTPPGLLKPDEVPKGWGLCEVHPKVIRQIKKPTHFSDHDRDGESAILEQFARMVFFMERCEPHEYHPSNATRRVVEAAKAIYDKHVEELV